MLTVYVFSTFVLFHAYCEEVYTNKYDGVDLEEILASERLLTGYVNCLLDLGPCTPDAKELKKIGQKLIVKSGDSRSSSFLVQRLSIAIQRGNAASVMGTFASGTVRENLPDAIENDCEKCTKRQREGADQVMHYIIENRPNDWLKLEQKYNENGSYKRKYLARKQIEDSKSTEKQDEDEEKESTEKQES